MLRSTMSTAEVVSPAKIRSLQGLFENDFDLCLKRLVLESRHSRRSIEPGVCHPSDHDPITVLCITDPEICGATFKADWSTSSISR